MIQRLNRLITWDLVLAITTISLLVVLFSVVTIIINPGKIVIWQSEGIALTGRDFFTGEPTDKSDFFSLHDPNTGKFVDGADLLDTYFGTLPETGDNMKVTFVRLGNHTLAYGEKLPLIAHVEPIARKFEWHISVNGIPVDGNLTTVTKQLVESLRPEKTYPVKIGDTLTASQGWLDEISRRGVKDLEPYRHATVLAVSWPILKVQFGDGTIKDMSKSWFTIE